MRANQPFESLQSGRFTSIWPTSRSAFRPQVKFIAVVGDLLGKLESWKISVARRLQLPWEETLPFDRGAPLFLLPTEQVTANLHVTKEHGYGQILEALRVP